MSSTIDGPAPGPIPASDIEARAIEWLWPFGASSDPEDDGPVGLIPKRHFSVLAGKRDVGKGLGWTHVAADLSRHGVNCLISAPEDDPEDTLRPRLEASGADLANIKFWNFALPRDMSDLAVFMAVEQIGYLVMDPFAAHLTDGIKRHSDNVRDVLTPLRKLIADFNAGCSIVDHVLKHVPSGSDLHDAIGGSSSGLVAASRMAFIVGRDPADSDHIVMAPVKHNITSDQLPAASFLLDTRPVSVLDPKTGKRRMDEFPYLVHQGMVRFDAWQLVGRGHDRPGPAADRLALAMDFITRYLYAAPEAVPAGLLKEDALQNGIAWRTARRAMDELGIVRSSQGRGCKYSLPDELRKTLDEQREADTALGDDLGLPLDESGMLTPEDFEKLLGGAAPDEEPDEDEGEKNDE